MVTEIHCTTFSLGWYKFNSIFNKNAASFTESGVFMVKLTAPDR